ncbi:unnamed protein product [Polarella glacialis]|uniref:Uncharacterized protein n=1 Tax=Polarella glacialis TaxID=89957 RepID=A0A813FN05_POLGL|nr:unnamed protein product [Polarella glacialis]
MQACACTCEQGERDDLPAVTAPDGTKHTCVRQSGILWPPHLAFLRNLPVQTRVLPDRHSMVATLVSSLKRLVAATKNPYGPAIPTDVVDCLCSQFAGRMLCAWGFPLVISEPRFQQWITMLTIHAIKNKCGHLFIEALDKNTSEFVSMCPCLYQQLAASIFQFTGGDNKLAGFKYCLTSPVHLVDCSTKELVSLGVGAVLKLQLIENDCVFFEGYSGIKREVLGSLSRLHGDNFSYCPDNNTWIDILGLEVPGLRPEMQPVSINKQFSRLWANSLGSREASWGRVRAVPKNKNVAISRPLGDQSRNPLSLCCRLLARFLDLCIATLPPELHMDRSTHSAVVGELRRLQCDPLGTGQPLKDMVDYGLLICSRDVENGFMRVKHSEALMAWRYVKQALSLLGKFEAWVTPLKTPPGHSNKFAVWSQRRQAGWIRMHVDDIEPLLVFLFRHMQFWFGETHGWQQEGVMMGIGAGGSIFRMTLVAHELQALQSASFRQQAKDRPDISISGMRFVDDVRVFVVFPLCMGEAWALEHARTFLEFVYPAHFVMKPDAVNPTVGMDIFTENGDVMWTARVRPLGNLVVYGDRNQQALVPYFS